MTDTDITITEPTYDAVLAMSLERCLVDGMVPPLVICLVGATGAVHVLRYRPPDMTTEHVSDELETPIIGLVVDSIGQSRHMELARDAVALH